MRRKASVAKHRAFFQKASSQAGRDLSLADPSEKNVGFWAVSDYSFSKAIIYHPRWQVIYSHKS